MKIVLVGAGSFVFALSVLHDAIVRFRMSDGELVLVDINRDILKVMEGIGRRIAQDSGVDIHVWSTNDRRKALPGADYVMLSAAIEGIRRWRMNFDILKRAGIPGQSRESGGVGGLVYSMRSITLAMDVCRDMERICPHAILLDVTNPVPRVVTAVNRYSAISAIGFCNIAWGGYPGYQWLAGLLDRKANEIDVVTAGLNHFAWLVEIHDRNTGEDLYPQVVEAIEKGNGRELSLLREWLREYGAIGVSTARHMSEFLPYDPDNSYHVSPPFHGIDEERNRRYENLLEISHGRRDWKSELEHRSWECAVEVAYALYNRIDMGFDMVNLLNKGYLPQLPDGRIVEVPAYTKQGALQGRVIPLLPGKAAEICRIVSDVHELAAECSVKGSRELAIRVIEIDPAITDKAVAVRALDEMLQAHSDILPQFR